MKAFRRRRLLRRSLILGAVGAIALAGGIVLGNFTRAGLSGTNAPMNEMAVLQDFTSARTAEQAKRRAAMSHPEALLATDIPDTHVCEGCDVRETRGRQLAAQLGLYDYATPSGVPDTTSEMTDAPTLPLPVLPSMTAAPPSRMAAGASATHP